MPFTGRSFKKHNHGLSGTQATKAAKVANAVMGRGVDEGEAIAIANKAAKQDKKSHDPATHGYHKMGM